MPVVVDSQSIRRHSLSTIARGTPVHVYVDVDCAPVVNDSAFCPYTQPG